MSFRPRFDRPQLKLYAYLPQGLYWDEYLMMISSFYRLVPTQKHNAVEGSSVQSEEDWRSNVWLE